MQREVSATIWNATKVVLNALITDCNVKIITSHSGVISPAGTILSPAITGVSRTVVAGDDIKADDHSDADGIVTKYNAMRLYDSCRRRSLAGTWTYGYTVNSVQRTGARDGSFPVATPASITPPVADVTLIQTDILEIITAGCAIHRTTLLAVAAGSEHVVIDECHSSCHGSCNRSRR